ncbi:hypothetical protein MASR2M117_21130 [Paludibacter sp.]
MKHILVILTIIISTFLTSCINEEGIGGTGSVEGYIFQVLHPDGDYTFQTDTTAGAEARVYIQYGDEKPYSDDMRTGPDGYFKFKYLTQGTYTIFAYNEYPNGQKEAVTQTVTIKSGEKKELNKMFVHSGKMFGKHQIEGQLKARFVESNKSGTETMLRDTIGVAGERIYIRKKGGIQPFNDIRTGESGKFIIEKLSPGTYEVYALSENPQTRETYILDTPTMKGLIEVTIKSDDTSVKITTIYAKLRS